MFASRYGEHSREESTPKEMWLENKTVKDNQEAETQWVRKTKVRKLQEKPAEIELKIKRKRKEKEKEKRNKLKPREYKKI